MPLAAHCWNRPRRYYTAFKKRNIYNFFKYTSLVSAAQKPFLSFSTESSANAPQQSMPTSSNISFVDLESPPRLISLKKFMAFTGTSGSATGAKYSALAMVISLQESHLLLFSSDHSNNLSRKKSQRHHFQLA